jgi:hypothetical protein
MCGWFAFRVSRTTASRPRFLIFHTPGRLVHHARQLSLRLQTAIAELALCLDAVRLTACFLAFPGTGSYRWICRALFWQRFGKEPSRGFSIHLTNLPALLNEQKARSRNGSTSHQLAFRLLSTVAPTLRTDWGYSSMDTRWLISYPVHLLCDSLPVAWPLSLRGPGH